MSRVPLPESIEIRPCGPIDARARPPGSKSITNRALVCAALAEGRSTLNGALHSEDTTVMIEALGQLGVPIAFDLAEHVVVVRGGGGRLQASSDDLYVANSGTTARFLAAVLALGHGTYRFDGTPRMQERPIEDLLAALRQLGADARSLHGTGCPPVIIRGNGLAGGHVTIRGDISSQFLSALLLVAPYAESDIEIEVDGAMVSQPYVRLTLAVMSSFGVDVDTDDLSRFRVIGGRRYRACEYEIEPDASAASYFFAAAAITGGRVTVDGLTRDSLQGDVRFVDLLERMGCRIVEADRALTVESGRLRGIEVDMNEISDTVPTLAAVALSAAGPTVIHGAGHIRHKETDRIAALATELRKLGAVVEELSDGLRIEPPKVIRRAEIDTYDDHRMAMSLALVGLCAPGIVIRDPACTAKTFPGYFDALAALSSDE